MVAGGGGYAWAQQHGLLFIKADLATTELSVKTAYRKDQQWNPYMVPFSGRRDCHLQTGN